MATTSAGVFFNFNRGSEWWGLCPEADALPAPLSGAPPKDGNWRGTFLPGPVAATLPGGQLYAGSGEPAVDVDHDVGAAQVVVDVDGPGRAQPGHHQVGHGLPPAEIDVGCVGPVSPIGVNREKAVGTGPAGFGHVEDDR